MDSPGYSFEIYKAFLKYSGFDRVSECCIGNIESWEKGLDVITFSVNTHNISMNKIHDMVADTGKEMADFILFIDNYNPSIEEPVDGLDKIQAPEPTSKNKPWIDN